MSETLAAPPSAAQPYPPPRRAWYAVGLLTLAYGLSFIDRYILGLLIPPIKAEFGLNDTQIGLMQGFAFGIFFAVMGVPFGLLADRANRRNTIAIGMALWSAATMGCGLAMNFVQLATARVLVGVGEAALVPNGYSYIADSFPPDRRARALSIFIMGTGIGAGLANIVGGLVVKAIGEQPTVLLPLVGEIASWKATFLIVGAPGILAALVLAFTVREPLRRGVAKLRPEAVTLGTVAPVKMTAFLARNGATLACLVGALCCTTVLTYANSTWMVETFRRSFGWQRGDAGIAWGFAYMIAATVGVVSGGLLADALRRRGVAHPTVKVAIIGCCGLVPFAWAMFQMPGPWSMLACYFLFALCHNLPYGVVPAALQEIAPNQLRGQVSAVYIFSISFVGLTVGATVPGWLVDHVYHDPARLRSAMAILFAVMAPLAALLALAALRPFRRSLADAKSWETG